MFFALVGVPLLGVPLAPSLASAMVCMFVAGLFTAPGIIAMFGIRQRSVPFELQGRTFAITISVRRGPMPFGAMLSGFVVGDVGVHRTACQKLFTTGTGTPSITVTRRMAVLVQASTPARRSGP